MPPSTSPTEGFLQLTVLPDPHGDLADVRCLAGQTSCQCLLQSGFVHGAALSGFSDALHQIGIGPGGVLDLDRCIFAYGVGGGLERGADSRRTTGARRGLDLFERSTETGGRWD